MSETLAVSTVTAPRLPAESQMDRALRDLIGGLRDWRIWHSMAFNDIRQRYRRSKIGQFWLTLSMAITIVGMGIIFSTLFKVRAEDYMPFVGIGLIVWALMSSLVNELGAACITSESYLRNYPTARSVVVYRTIVRNLILFAHNLIVIPPLLIFGGVHVDATILLSIVGIALLTINAVWVGMLLGPLCARFRDLQQILQNIVALSMFLTPVMWRNEQLQGRFDVLTKYNPFGTFLELIRGPMLGHVPALHFYYTAIVLTLTGFAIAIPFYTKFRRRIVYWL